MKMESTIFARPGTGSEWRHHQVHNTAIRVGAIVARRAHRHRKRPRAVYVGENAQFPARSAVRPRTVEDPVGVRGADIPPAPRKGRSREQVNPSDQVTILGAVGSSKQKVGDTVSIHVS